MQILTTLCFRVTNYRKMLSCVASIDQGTSSSRVIIFDRNGRVLASHQAEHTQHYPHPGHVEHDPEQIWQTVRQCLSEAANAVSQPIKLETIGITNQRETTVVWNKQTGKPYHNAIVWNDNRTGDICNRISREGGKDKFRSKTGLPVATYFSASKLVYLLDTVPGLRADAESGNALFGTIDCWLIWKLSGNKVHKTDVTNASRTMLMNLETLQWDPEILDELKIPQIMLPAIHASNHCFGTVDASAYSSEKYSSYHGISITGVLGDQQAALFGQTCFAAGDAKCTYGTGAFLLMNTGSKIVHSRRGLLTTVAYKLEGDGSAVFALEGSVAYGGSVMQWLRDNLGLLSSAAESEAIAASVADNGGVYFVPAFAGLYAPYWRQDARGIIAGLTAYNTKAHIVRAALEASAFQTTEVVQAMHLDVEPYELPRIGTLRVDGGQTKNNLLMQFQSDLLEIPLVVPKVLETTALGAAFIAGLGSGLWKDQSELGGLWGKGASWNHKMSHEDRSKLVKL